MNRALTWKTADQLCLSSFRAIEKHPEKPNKTGGAPLLLKENSLRFELDSEILNIYAKPSTLSPCFLCFQKLALMFVRTIYYEEMPRLYDRG